MPPEEIKKEAVIRDVFYVSLVFKGLNAAAETLLGVLLLFTDVTAIAQTYIHTELVEDPGDYIANSLQGFAGSVSPQSQTFAALYLLSHGIVKGLLVIGLLRNKLWAYPASLAVFSLFIAYQVIKWMSTHSPLLVALTVFDLVVMWLIWHEYRRIKSNS